MSSLRRSLVVSSTVELIARYLSDLTTSVQWDPHTVACERLDDGPVRVGARYRHTRQFQGHEVTLEMELVELQPGARVAWSGGYALASGREEFAFRPADGGGTVVEHEVQVTLSGVARIGAAMVPSVMRRIADDGTDSLRASLEALT